MSSRQPVIPDAVEDKASDAGRERVLDAIVSAPAPASIDEIATTLGVHPNTVRFHVGHLVTEGLIETIQEKGSGRGRPRTLYRSTPEAFHAGPQNDRLLAEVLMSDFINRNSSRVADAAWQAGHAWACRLIDQQTLGHDAAPEDIDPDQHLDELMGLLSSWGFAPSRVESGHATDDQQSSDRQSGDQQSDSEKVVDEKVVELHRCPFSREVAERSDLVCALHSGIAAGALEGLRSPWRVRQLIPHSAPGRCDLVCEQTP